MTDPKNLSSKIKIYKIDKNKQKNVWFSVFSGRQIQCHPIVSQPGIWSCPSWYCKYSNWHWHFILLFYLQYNVFLCLSPAIRRSFQGSMKFTISHFFCRPQFFVTLWFSMYLRRSIFTGRKSICWLMILKLNLMISMYVEVALSCFFSS